MRNFICLLTGIVFYISGIAQNSYSAGIITDSIRCAAVPENMYAAFLPSGYSRTHTYPVVFIHEPGARAKLAISVFKNAAEKYQCILICSNITHNGMDAGQQILASQQMQYDVLHRFSADTSRQYIGGFSGGSRLASVLAIQQKNFAGIIACGAGLSTTYYVPGSFNSGLVYAAVTGSYDMNYTEMQDMVKVMRKNNITGRLFEFNGGHEWCDSATALHIFEWLRYCEMQHGLIEKDLQFTDSILQHACSSIQNLIQTQQYFEASVALNALEQDSVNVHEKDCITACRNALNKPEIKKEIEYAQDILEEEKSKRDDYLLYVNNRIPGTYIRDSSKLKNDVWWKQTGNKLQKDAADSMSMKGKSAARLYDMLWRACWEQGDGYYAAKQYAAARELFYLYTLLNGESKYAWLNLAEAEAMLGDANAAVRYLQTAVKQGLNNAEYLQNDNAFAAMRDNKKFAALLEEMKNTKEQ